MAHAVTCVLLVIMFTVISHMPILDVHTPLDQFVVAWSSLCRVWSSAGGNLSLGVLYVRSLRGQDPPRLQILGI